MNKKVNQMTNDELNQALADAVGVGVDFINNVKVSENFVDFYVYKTSWYVKLTKTGFIKKNSARQNTY